MNPNGLPSDPAVVPRHLWKPSCWYLHKGGQWMIRCGHCHLYLTNRSELISHRFQGSTGRASLYNRVWNLTKSEKQEREMLTGKHIVRDVYCERCNSKLGWYYEFAMEPSQRYKENKVILEKALIEEVENFPDPYKGWANTANPRSEDSVAPVLQLDAIQMGGPVVGIGQKCRGYTHSAQYKLIQSRDPTILRKIKYDHALIKRKEREQAAKDNHEYQTRLEQRNQQMIIQQEHQQQQEQQQQLQQLQQPIQLHHYPPS